MVPSNFDPLPGFPEAQAIGKTLTIRTGSCAPGRVVYLSTIGAQAKESNLLTQHTIIEKAIGTVANRRLRSFVRLGSWRTVVGM